jgi:hypothetical protein
MFCVSATLKKNTGIPSYAKVSLGGRGYFANTFNLYAAILMLNIESSITRFSILFIPQLKTKQ